MAYDFNRTVELRAAVYAALDYASAQAQVEKAAAALKVAQKAYEVASVRIQEIWDRESARLFGEN